MVSRLGEVRNVLVPVKGGPYISCCGFPSLNFVVVIERRPGSGKSWTHQVKLLFEMHRWEYIGPWILLRESLPPDFSNFEVDQPVLILKKVPEEILRHIMMYV